jgi:hypothetical protein
VDVVDVEVVDAPVSQLLLDNGLDLLRVVERVPEFGDKDEVFALDEAVFDGTGDALAAFYFVAVVWLLVSRAVGGCRAKGRAREKCAGMMTGIGRSGKWAGRATSIDVITTAGPFSLATRAQL